MFGGESSEHDVSLMSVKNVYAALDNEKYDVSLCFVDRSGKWWLVDTVDGRHQGCPQLFPVMGQGEFLVVPGQKVLKIDVVWAAMHGENAEDGNLQGVFAMMHIPLIGCDTIASVICWDKLITKQLLEQASIATSPYEICYQNNPPSFATIEQKFGLPFFVKPTRAGSSVGVSRVSQNDQYDEALQLAFRYSDPILLEKTIEGRELEVAVLGNPPLHKESPVGEIKPGEEFYSYEDKYDANSKAVVLPRADVDEGLADRIRTVAHKAYEVLGCRGYARVDFLVSHDGEIYVNEINTLPGFTNISQYPKMWHEAGIKYSELIDTIIMLAFKK